MPCFWRRWGTAWGVTADEKGSFAKNWPVKLLIRLQQCLGPEQAANYRGLEKVSGLALKRLCSARYSVRDEISKRAPSLYPLLSYLQIRSKKKNREEYGRKEDFFRRVTRSLNEVPADGALPQLRPVILGRLSLAGPHA